MMAQVIHWSTLVMLTAPAVAFMVLAFTVMAGIRAPERFVGGLSRACFMVGALASLLSAGAVLFHSSGPIHIHLGTLFWTRSHRFDIGLHVDHISAPFALLTAVLTGVIGAFSDRYLHREAGHRRFFTLLALFATAMHLLVLGDTVDLLFVGWELVGVTSALLIAFFHERPEPVRHGLWAFVVYRICDVGLLTAAVLLHHHEGSGDLQPGVIAGSMGTTLGLLFLWAAMGKSAQVPFSGWLPRAMEGPTPSSAIFYGALSIHVGAYLLLRTSPMWSHSPWVGAAIVAVGLTTACYATLVGRVHADIKCVLAYASMTQAGLIFAEVGLGLYTLAMLHVAGHSVVRTLQLLRAPSLLHEHHRITNAIGHHTERTGAHYERMLPAKFRRWAYRLAIHRGYLDALAVAVIWARIRRALFALDAFEQRLVRLIGGGEVNGQPRRIADRAANVTSRASDRTETVR